MTNRLEELKGHPEIKKAFDRFINSLASHRNFLTDDIAERINILNKDIEEELKEFYK